MANAYFQSYFGAGAPAPLEGTQSPNYKGGPIPGINTNVDKDGMLEGPDLDEVRRIAGIVRGRFLYSGGIGSLDDLRGLVALRQVNLAGVIVGKALYEGRFGVAEAQDVLDAA